MKKIALLVGGLSLAVLVACGGGGGGVEDEPKVDASEEAL